MMVKQHFVVLKAYNQGIIDWKTCFCHLYPVRVKDFTEFAAVNYDSGIFVIQPVL
jgi:hypothetical protein